MIYAIGGGKTLLHMLSVPCWGNPASANLALTKPTSLGLTRAHVHLTVLLVNCWLCCCLCMTVNYLT